MTNPLDGKRVLITAGPTREYIDPVRYISNDSSGKMGWALAAAAIKAGAKVTLVSGPVTIHPTRGVKTVHVVSAREMCLEALKAANSADIIICAAAVSDFRPKKYSRKKIKSGAIRNTQYAIQLIKNPDILKELGRRKKPNQLLIGFALETENLVKNARRKMKEKNCDIIIANNKAAVGKETTSLKIITQKDIKSIRGKKTAVSKEIIKLVMGLERR